MAAPPTGAAPPPAPSAPAPGAHGHGFITIRLTGNWTRMAQFFGDPGLDAIIKRAMLKEGHELRNQIVRGILSGGNPKFAPHSPTTLLLRKAGGFGGTKILVVTGALVGSVTVAQVGDDVFVGVRRGSGKKADIASIHEYGRTWTKPMTVKQRRWLMMMLKKSGATPRAGSGGGLLRVRIPPRPFIAPVLKRNEGKIGGRIAKTISEEIHKRMGGK